MHIIVTEFTNTVASNLIDANFAANFFDSSVIFGVCLPVLPFGRAEQESRRAVPIPGKSLLELRGDRL